MAGRFLIVALTAFFLQEREVSRCAWANLMRRWSLRAGPGRHLFWVLRRGGSMRLRMTACSLRLLRVRLGRCLSGMATRLDGRLSLGGGLGPWLGSCVMRRVLLP